MQNMENEVMMNEVMEEAVEVATTSTKGLKNIAIANIATGVALGAGLTVLVGKGIKKLVAWGKAQIEAKRAADAATANATTDSTDVEPAE